MIAGEFAAVDASAAAIAHIAAAAVILTAAVNSVDDVIHIAAVVSVNYDTHTAVAHTAPAVAAGDAIATIHATSISWKE